MLTYILNLKKTISIDLQKILLLFSILFYGGQQHVANEN